MVIGMYVLSRLACRSSQPRHVDLMALFKSYTKWSKSLKDVKLGLWFSQDPSKYQDCSEEYCFDLSLY